MREVAVMLQHQQPRSGGGREAPALTCLIRLLQGDADMGARGRSRAREQSWLLLPALAARISISRTVSSGQVAGRHPSACWIWAESRARRRRADAVA